MWLNLCCVTAFPTRESFIIVSRTQWFQLLDIQIFSFHTYDYARHFVSACTHILEFEGTHQGVENQGKLTRVSVFRLLERLLVIHGHWCYKRITQMYKSNTRFMRWSTMCSKLSDQSEAENRVLVDGKLITNRGTSMELSIAIVEKLFDCEKALDLTVNENFK